jgi:hypothetical protein
MTVPSETTPTDTDLFYVNGVDALTGQYLQPPLEASEILEQAAVELQATPEGQRKYLKERKTFLEMASFGFDEDHLDEPSKAGWGVICTANEDAHVLAAVEELIRHRAKQFKSDLVKQEPLIYQPGASVVEFLDKHGVKRGIGQVAKVPYYLLIIGDPGKIPFRFQYELDSEYAVGRLHFERPEEYRAYIEQLIAYETAGVVPNRREAVFWAPENRDVHDEPEKATQRSAEYLVQALYDATNSLDNFQKHLFRASQATKPTLLECLARPQPPALVFTASHGLGYPKGHALQRQLQGALMTQEGVFGAPVKAEQRLAGQDVADNGVHVHGLIHYAFACFGAGTPTHDDYFYKHGHPTDMIANAAFVSDLSRQMLAHGALAFVGHMDRAWGYSFRHPGGDHDPKHGTAREAFRRALRRLSAGGPVGHALRDQHDRGVQLSSSLLEDLHEKAQGVNLALHDDLTLAMNWTERNDARAYIVIGDPAVRLRVEAMQGASEPCRVCVTMATPRSATTLTPATQTVANQQPQASADPSTAQGNAQPAENGATVSPVEEDEFLTDPLAAWKLSPEDKVAQAVRQAWGEQTIAGYQQLQTMFDQVLKAFIGPYWLTVHMYYILFLVGVLGFIAAAVLGALYGIEFALLFGGLSVAAFLTYFVSGPLQALEQNLMLITWLGLLYNTYWTRLLYANSPDPAQIQRDLEAISQATLNEVRLLIDKHDQLSSKRPTLNVQTATATHSQPTQQEASGAGQAQGKGLSKP